MPWLALALPLAAAGVALTIARAITLRRSAQRWVDRIFELSLDMITAVDFEGNYRVVNPAFERTLGYAKEEMLGRPFGDYLHPDDVEAAQRAFGQLLAGDDVNAFETRFICRDGSARRLEWNARGMLQEGVIYGIARDVTERRRVDAELQTLAEAQSALRRVATVVAGGASQTEVFGAIAEECSRLFGTREIGAVRFDGDAEQFVLASSGQFRDPFPAGSRLPLGGENATSRVHRTGRAVRMEDYSGSASGAIGAAARALGVRSVVGTPILVEGRLWGAMIIGTTADEPLPPDTETRLAEFTDLMATAIANTESRDRAERLADEQAALRRVATVVARRIGSDPVFSAVADEVEVLFGAEITAVVKFEPDWCVSVKGRRGGPHDPGAVVKLDPEYVVAAVRRTGAAARFDADDPSAPGVPAFPREIGIRSGVATPLVIDGVLWGAVTIASCAAPLVAGAERRLAGFTDLVATAISNTEARAEVERLAMEQAALRRVATLVAEGARPQHIFDAVIAEVEGLVGADEIALGRCGDGEEPTMIAYRGPSDGRLSEGAAQVSAPITVEGRLWGTIVASWTALESPPADAEVRMAKFADLLDTAIASADTRDQLTASRARLLTEADDARRRVVRDLHDGAQQRLVHSIVTLRLAQGGLEEGEAGEAPALVSEALAQVEQANVELRELAHGILPSVLTRGGLRAGVAAVVARIALPVRLDVTEARFPAEIEASAYFIVAEALTNVVKHAHATSAAVKAWVEDGALRVEVVDDGVGGADTAGHGLVGLSDRATALGGRFTVGTSASGGTAVSASFPL